MKKVNLVILLLLFATLLNCSGDKTELEKKRNNSNKEIFIEGTIATIGNEPFTELAIQVNDSTSYILECNKAISDSLLKQQGELYKVYYDNKSPSSKVDGKIIVSGIKKVIK